MTFRVILHTNEFKLHFQEILIAGKGTEGFGDISDPGMTCACPKTKAMCFQ